jgi:hypothetical protein
MSPCKLLTMCSRLSRGRGWVFNFRGLLRVHHFTTGAERTLVTPQTLSSSGVLAYQRCHDDIVCVYANSYKFVSFRTEVRSHAAHFKVLCSHTSASAVTYLDLTISIVRSRRIKLEPEFKKVVIPLAPESGHTIAVHGAWPVAVPRRNINLSGGKVHSSALVEYYRSHNAAPGTLRVPERTLLGPPARAAGTPSDRSSTQAVRMKATANLLLISTLPSFVSNLQPPADQNLRTRIAWRYSFSSLAQIIQRSNCLHLKGGRGGDH